MIQPKNRSNFYYLDIFKPIKTFKYVFTRNKLVINLQPFPKS